MARLFKYADARRIPLRTIVVTVAVVAAVYLAGQLVYRLRTLVLLIIVAGFVALGATVLVARTLRELARETWSRLPSRRTPAVTNHEERADSDAA